MPRYVIPKGAYDQQQGGKFESSTIDFRVIVVYDQKDDGVCEAFAQTSNQVINDLQALGVYIDVGRPLRIDQTATGGSDIDPALYSYAASSPGGSTTNVPFICEGYNCTENPAAKSWTVSAAYRLVTRENPGHVEAIIHSAPRMAPAWRIGDTTSIDWTTLGGNADQYNQTVDLGDISGEPFDINTQPRQFVVEGIEARFSFVIRAPYYATHAATTLTTEALWTYWTEGGGAQSVGKRSNGTEWGESPAATWAQGEWVVHSIEVSPINAFDHKCTVTMRTDEWQVCDQLVGQIYGGPVIPEERSPQPPNLPTGVGIALMNAAYVMWSNPYPLKRDVWGVSDFPAYVYDYVSEALTA